MRLELLSRIGLELAFGAAILGPSSGPDRFLLTKIPAGVVAGQVNGQTAGTVDREAAESALVGRFQPVPLFMRLQSSAGKRPKGAVDAAVDPRCSGSFAAA